MRILGLDIGEARIGVALCDPSELLASPVTAIERTNESSDLDELIRLVREHDAGEIVVGLPLSLSGSMGDQAHRTRGFADRLSKHVPIPVKMVDERLSTVQAERMLRESGVEPSRDRGRADAAAAAIILQSYLDSGRATYPSGKGPT